MKPYLSGQAAYVEENWSEMVQEMEESLRLYLKLVLTLCTSLNISSYILTGKKTIVDYNVISPSIKSGKCIHRFLTNYSNTEEISVLTSTLENIPCSPGILTSRVRWRTISHFV